MSERALRNIFVFGTVFFLLVLAGMTVNSLSQITSARTTQVVEQVASGKRTWQKKNCNDCHTILGIGGYYAPDVTKVVDRRGVEWIRGWLKNPRAVDAKATMPNQYLNDTEVENLVAFAQWVNKIDTNNWPPQPMTMLGGGGTPGALLFQQKGCSGCHMINGQGASGPGPDLSHITIQRFAGLPNTADFLSKWLEDPQKLKPGTTMPRIPLSQAERDSLIQYLISLK